LGERNIHDLALLCEYGALAQFGSVTGTRAEAAANQPVRASSVEEGGRDLRVCDPAARREASSELLIRDQTTEASAEAGIGKTALRCPVSGPNDADRSRG
jgi:hypothetical protein